MENNKIEVHIVLDRAKVRKIDGLLQRGSLRSASRLIKIFVGQVLGRVQKNWDWFYDLESKELLAYSPNQKRH